MRTVSEAWVANFTEDASVPGRLAVLMDALNADATRNRQWVFDNATAANVVDATLTSSYDPSGATLPIETCTLQVENSVNDADEAPETHYDFSDIVNKTALAKPCTLDFSLGLAYDDGTVETLTITRQQLTDAEVSTDGQYVTFTTESFTKRLDKDIFYGGRYDAAGIPASTLFAEVLDDALFPVEGDWRYKVGTAVTSTVTPLWSRADAGVLQYLVGTSVVSDTVQLKTPDAFDYYHIDPALDTVRVYAPIPPVTHREALAMLAAYCGAYLTYRDDGSLDVLKIGA